MSFLPKRSKTNKLLVTNSADCAILSPVGPASVRERNMDMNNQHSADVSRQLAAAPVGKLLLKLAAPTVVAQLVNLLYNIVDRIYIGHMPDVGRVALTGIGLCFPVLCLTGAFTMLIAQGGAPRAAIAMGEGDDARAERIMGSCFTCLIIASLALTGVFWAFGEPLLWIFGCSQETILYALPYMATVLSQAISGIWVVRFLMGEKSTLRLRRECLRPSWRIMAPVLALGVSPFIMQSTEALLNISFNASLQRYGGDVAVGAMTIASTVLQMVWIPSQGLGQGAQPIISYNYGARNAKRVKEAFFALLKASCTLMMTFWLLVELFPQAFIRIFNSDPALMDTAVWTLRVYVASLGLFGIQLTVQQTFMSIGKAKASLFIACLRKIILLIPLIFLLPRFFENKVLAVFLAEPVSDLISIAASAVTFFFVFRSAMAELEQDPQQ